MASDLTLVGTLEQLKRLHVAFPSHAGMKNNPDGTARVYFDELHGLSEHALRAAASVVIQSDNYFPKVARLREVAWDWTRRHDVHVERETGDLLWCPRCQTRAKWKRLYRPMVYKDPHPKAGYAVLSDDGAFVYLEEFERLLCDCATPCRYVPDPGFEQLVMSTEKIAWRYGRTSRELRHVNRPTLSEV